ncbi:hypothetical protein GCM10007301_45270 [Azorhizobium oxalatiphilum]|uniref:Uncharacterized protein n=1 Tax=Azorhizobium oxalatiphilum TaxID=980631 RepID=A0A917FGE4_9HYPH|nr:hypothetical protein [Azorhizobium oxalatiphilum]GGF80065.1 hypothetical protein GCM10007301_45270 [Azorhizobium oxalatiphilum]
MTREANPTVLDDDRISDAAQRVIERFRLREAAPEIPVRALPTLQINAHDSGSVLLAIDDMRQAIDRMDRLFQHRDATYAAALGQIERQLARLEGRVDALAAENAMLSTAPGIDAEWVLGRHQIASSAMKKEFANILDLMRTMLDEARAIHEISVKNGK